MHPESLLGLSSSPPSSVELESDRLAGVLWLPYSAERLIELVHQGYHYITRFGSNQLGSFSNGEAPTLASVICTEQESSDVVVVTRTEENKPVLWMVWSRAKSSGR